MGHTIGCASRDADACDCQPPAEPKPVVGMAATYSIGADMHPCTVIAVERNGRTIRLSHDDVKGPKLFVPNMNPANEHNVIVATLRSTGRYMVRGTNYGFISLGKRRNYSDPSF